MNASNRQSLAFLVIAIIGTFLIMAGLVWYTRSYTRPEPVGAARAQERRKNLEEIRNAGADQLNNFAWQDPSKGLVRLPIDYAIQLTLKEWQNPAAARSNLIALSAQAAPAPPPPPPPNPYE